MRMVVMRKVIVQHVLTPAFSRCRQVSDLENFGECITAFVTQEPCGHQEEDEVALVAGII